jgi:DNA-binding transcriptional MerR regulator
MRVLPRPSRTASGYRQYPPEAADRVLLVRHAIGMGFRIDELSRVLSVRDHGGAPCKQVHALAVAKLAHLDQKISELVDLRSRLQAIVKGWESKLANTPEGQRARLLESLIHPPSRKDESK